MEIKLSEGYATVDVKSGSYYLCDPCYVMTDEEWDNFLDSNPHDGESFLSGELAVAFDTRWGDGIYILEGKDVPLSVDSGTLGIVSKSEGADYDEYSFEIEEDYILKFDLEKYVLSLFPKDGNSDGEKYLVDVGV